MKANGLGCKKKHLGAKTCPTCNGDKKIQCTKCNAQGELLVKCDKCQGSGINRPCHNCRGSGVNHRTGEYCYWCKGTGSSLGYMEGVQWYPNCPCPYCNGDRVVLCKCHACEGGIQKCPTCDGKGYVCEECKNDEHTAYALDCLIESKIGLIALSVIRTDPSKNIWTKGDIPVSRIDAFAKRYNSDQLKDEYFYSRGPLAFLDCSTFFQKGIGVLLTKESIFVTYPPKSSAYKLTERYDFSSLADYVNKYNGMPPGDAIIFPPGNSSAIDAFMKGIWGAVYALLYFRQRQSRSESAPYDSVMEALLDTIRNGNGDGPKGPVRPKEGDVAELDQSKEAVEEPVSLLQAFREEIEKQRQWPIWKITIKIWKWLILWPIAIILGLGLLLGISGYFIDFITQIK